MKRKIITICILIAYCALLIKVMVFKEVSVIKVGPLRLKFGGTHNGQANLIPFKTIMHYLLGKSGFIIGGLNIVGNIVLLVPIGFLVPLVYKNLTWKNIIFLAVASGLSIELLQVFLKVGIFDIDDVILNGIGVLIGYWLFNFFTKQKPS